MKRISEINEGWGSMIKRDITSDVRDEEKNTLEYKVLHNPEWVDMGVYHLWRNCNYGVNHPYESGEKINPLDDEDICTHETAYSDLIAYSEKYEGTCKGVPGIYMVAKNENVLFFPYTSPDKEVHMLTKRLSYRGSEFGVSLVLYKFDLKESSCGPLDTAGFVREIKKK